MAVNNAHWSKEQRDRPDIALLHHFLLDSLGEQIPCPPTARSTTVFHSGCHLDHRMRSLRVGPLSITPLVGAFIFEIKRHHTTVDLTSVTVAEYCCRQSLIHFSSSTWSSISCFTSAIRFTVWDTCESTLSKQQTHLNKVSPQCAQELNGHGLYGLSVLWTKELISVEAAQQCWGVGGSWVFSNSNGI